MRLAKFSSAARPDSRPGRSAFVIAVVLALVVAAGCGGDGDDIATSDQSGTTGSTGSTGSSDATDQGDSDETTTTVEPKPRAALDDASTETRSAEPSEEGMETAQLVGVRVGTHEGYERVVFEFDGAVPGYDVGYLELPPSEDGSGDPVEVSGTEALSVRMFPASGVVLIDEGFEETYTGPRRVAGAGAAVTEVVNGGDFEAQLTWFVGTEGRNPFVVSTTSSPSRIIIDIAE